MKSTTFNLSAAISVKIFMDILVAFVLSMFLVAFGEFSNISCIAWTHFCFTTDGQVAAFPSPDPQFAPGFAGGYGYPYGYGGYGYPYDRGLGGYQGFGGFGGFGRWC